jgi:hypothetical protein
MAAIHRGVWALALAFPLVLGGCPPPPEDDPRDKDLDGDGFSPNQGDCSDLDPARFPGAEETCNQVDDNCDSRVDEQFDLDQDGHSTCNGGDCKDDDPTVFPGGQEVSDGLDNDCNGVIDDQLADFDDDGDGFSEVDGPLTPGGDCDDDDAMVSPNSIEVVGNSVDDDCDGEADNEPQPCDTGLNPADPTSFAKAMGMCAGLVSADFVTTGGVSSPQARAIVPNFGNGGILPFEGASMVHFASGQANTGTHDSGTNLNNQIAHPLPQPSPGDGCGQADQAQVNDYTEYVVKLQVPANAQGFSYKFMFLSAEYFVFRCTQFDDSFLAILEPEDPNSTTFRGNISFDANGKFVSINNGFFQVCSQNHAGPPPNVCIQSTNPLFNGTGYSLSNAGATLPLTTTVSVTPGEIINLRFIIFDEGDHILDSSVLLDKFVWLAEGTPGGPITIP